MVSIFGLKIGGDKKKKPEQPTPRSIPRQDRKIDQDTLGAAKSPVGTGTHANSYPKSVRSMPQPSGSQTNLLTPNARAVQAFYNPASQALASASMHDLSRSTSSGDTALPYLQPAISNPNLATRWNNGSSPNLTASPEPISRPTTSERQRPWVDPLDVHFAKGQTAVPTTKSPLSQSHHDDDRFPRPNPTDHNPLPRALNINKQPAPAIPPRSALRNPPSPPPSVKTSSEKASSEIDRLSILEKPIVPAAAADGRPSSRGSHRNMPTSLRELMATDDFLFEEPASIPTPPPSLPRASNESGNRASINEWGEPVIQNVRAKRETMTISAAKRQSLEKMIDNLERSAALDRDGRPRTSSGARVGRPVLTLDVKFPTLDRNGPSSAPFAARQRSESPFGPSSHKTRTGVPAAAVGALGRPTRLNTQGIRRPTADEYGIPPERPSEDDSECSSPDSPTSPDSPIMPRNGPLASPMCPVVEPTSPDSPIMPRDGPLASPMYPPVRSISAEPRRDRLDTSFRFPDWSVSAGNRSNSEDSVPRPLQPSKLPSAESVNWPLTAPPMFTSESPSQISSLPARAQSPFAVPSFSRPWTPTNVRPGTPVNTTELAVPTGRRGPSPSPRGPPPRRLPEYALRNPPGMKDVPNTEFI
ncbi:hypothetical protein SCUP234_11443 [Seiridium cupressi]